MPIAVPTRASTRLCPACGRGHLILIDWGAAYVPKLDRVLSAKLRDLT
jgi:hypothetical protein